MTELTLRQLQDALNRGDVLVPIAQAAVLLDTYPTRITRWVQRGSLPAIRVGGLWCVLLDDASTKLADLEGVGSGGVE